MLIPQGGTFILVGEGQWGESAIPPDRRAIPFLKRDGQYWGPPPDDDTAIRELDRLRRSGAELIVFDRPAFWWLDHYRGLRQHLDSQLRCVLKMSAWSHSICDLKDASRTTVNIMMEIHNPTAA
jgi:hypothetical protein